MQRYIYRSFCLVSSIYREICPTVALKKCLPLEAGSHSGFPITWQHLLQKLISSLHLSEETDHIAPFTVNAPVPVCALVHVGWPREEFPQVNIHPQPFVLLLHNACFRTGPVLFRLSRLIDSPLSAVKTISLTFYNGPKKVVNFYLFLLLTWLTCEQARPCRQLFSTELWWNSIANL